jgi:hypothetical protein
MFVYQDVTRENFEVMFAEDTNTGICYVGCRSPWFNALLNQPQTSLDPRPLSGFCSCGKNSLFHGAKGHCFDFTNGHIALTIYVIYIGVGLFFQH